MHGKRKKPGSMHRVRIIDGDALRAVLQEVYGRTGTHRTAAEWLGIEKHTFTKLLNGTVSKAMSFATYSSILEALGGRAAEHGRLPDPVIEFGAEPSLPQIEAEREKTGKTAEEAKKDLWARADAKALADSNLFDTFRSGVLAEDGDFVWSIYEQWLEREIRRLSEKARPLLPVIRKHRAYQDLFREFLERVRGGSEHPDPADRRIRLALFRALDPLTDAEATWGMERSVHEMHEDGDLEEYLRVALKREEIMLRRERDLERVQDCVPPMSYGAWLAGVGEEGYEANNPVTSPELWERWLGEGEEVPHAD